MKKFLALAIFALVSQPAHAGIFDLMIYGPPARTSTATAASRISLSKLRSSAFETIIATILR